MSDEIKKPEAVASAEKKTAARVKAAKPKRQVLRGRAYIHASYNNTIVTVTDLEGNALSWSSAGHLGFTGPKKATPYAAGQVIRDVSERIKPYGVRELAVFVTGVGTGRESAVRSLHASGFNILGIKDITPVPHNGPRAPKPRRI